MAALARRRHLIIVSAGYLAGIAAYPKLPPWSARPFIAFLLPTTAALIYELVRRVWERDPIRDGEGTFEPTYDAILSAVVVFVIAIHLLVVATLTGVLPPARIWLMRVTIVLFGLLIARIGNLLPRTRPNLAFGIRTPRTLTNRRLWIQTHRIAGYMTVCVGAVFVVSGAFLSKQAIQPVIGSAVIGAFTLVVISHYKYARGEPGS